MKDAEVDNWRRESQIPTRLLGSIRQLNVRFLDLISTRLDSWDAACPGLCGALAKQVAELSSEQRAAAANCPYALFDLRFHDDAHWRSRLRSTSGFVGESTRAAPDMLEFTRVAIFFAWHAAESTRFAAPLLLGMHPLTVHDFNRATIDCLPALASAEAVNLTARWSNCTAYWRALTSAAVDPQRSRLRKVQLYGLQLATATHLP